MYFRRKRSDLGDKICFSKQTGGAECESVCRSVPPVTSAAALFEIYRFHGLGELGTAGQPTEAQFRTIREAGFDVVINLALPTSDSALAGEGSIVAGLGMSYVHIPVPFRAPTSLEFRAFTGVMAAFDRRRVFVHCAANKRVSVFVFLYRVLYQRAVITDAEHDLHAIWQPDEVWSRFIQVQLRRLGPEA